jgi:hypothetical protein
MLPLLACSNAGNSGKSAATIEEERLLHEPLRAAPVLIQRLRNAVQIRDGVLMVEGDLDFYLLPQNSSWIVDCGFTGIRAIFGNPIGGDESGRNDVTVVLTLASLEKVDCRELAPIVGRELRAIVLGHSPSFGHSANED